MSNTTYYKESDDFEAYKRIKDSWEEPGDNLNLVIAEDEPISREEIEELIEILHPPKSYVFIEYRDGMGGIGGPTTVEVIQKGLSIAIEWLAEGFVLAAGAALFTKFAKTLSAWRKRMRNKFMSLHVRRLDDYASYHLPAYLDQKEFDEALAAIPGTAKSDVGEWPFFQWHPGKKRWVNVKGK